ncbi:lymphotoxin-alpha [Garra rufa]|uniref:lymphotoxin-alpha n=1 Tax=Garra rufa TaxID=137080 RepID=UPI003CCEBC47
MNVLPFSLSLLVTEMTSSSHPRFRLLIGWCCIMTSALLMLTVYVSISSRKQVKPGPIFSDYIRLIRDDKEPWIYNNKKMNTSKSFSLKNGTIELKISGLYQFHVQVHFKNIVEKQLATVTLLRNEGRGIQKRRLSEVKRNGPGSLTMIYLDELERSMSISLDIDPIDSLSREYFDTYWEIILFNNE